jgi:hypothetical protein
VRLRAPSSSDPTICSRVSFIRRPLLALDMIPRPLRTVCFDLADMTEWILSRSLPRRHRDRPAATVNTRAESAYDARQS